MANGNGKNGKNGDAKNGDAKNGDATKDTEESSGGKTVRGGASRSGSAAASTTAGESATQWQVKPAETATIVVPARSMVPVLAGTAALVATTGAIYAFYRWRQGQLAAQDGATPLPDAEQAPTPAATQPASPAPTPTSAESKAKRHRPLRFNHSARSKSGRGCSGNGMPVAPVVCAPSAPVTSTNAAMQRPINRKLICVISSTVVPARRALSRPERRGPPG